MRLLAWSQTIRNPVATSPAILLNGAAAGLARESGFSMSASTPQMIVTQADPCHRKDLVSTGPASTAATDAAPQAHAGTAMAMPLAALLLGALAMAISPIFV